MTDVFIVFIVFIVVFLIACLALAIVVPLLSLYISVISDTDSGWYDKRHGMKYTLTDSSFTAEWDYSSPLTMLKLLKLFIQGEDNQEQRRKYIREYTRLKKSLKDAGYDVSDFPDYEIK